MKKFLLLLLSCSLLHFIPAHAQKIVFDSLDINNINARINSNGNLFWDTIQNAKFEVSKGSGKCTIYNSSLWIGGIDTIGMLHFAGERFEEQGHDYWTGPISKVYDSAYDAKWDKVWKIKKADVDYHKNHWWQPGYVIPPSILNWPGNGDTSLGQSHIIAPFFDNNGDGIYNPADGDYPQIKGDEAIFFVFNDARKIHTESHGIKLGIEVRGMAYVFGCNQDSALWNTLFLNYKIINRSATRYDSAYIGIFTDLDIGYPNDDYIGCDVKRGSYYGYNSKKIDGYGQTWAYGAFPPAQAVTFLAGPFMDIDGIDNPPGLCDAGINGANFGNGIIDDERFGLTKFVYFINPGQGAPYYCSDPDNANDYYHYLKGYWKDDTQMLYGGNAHVGNGAYGPPCNFMFPANSDSCNWGTGGIPPNPQYWTEITAGNIPDDRRGLGICGPFIFYSGDTQEMDLAYVFGRDYLDSNAWSGVTNMLQRVDSIRKYFTTGIIPCGSGFWGISDITQANPQITIYPNPADNFLTVESSFSNGEMAYEIFDITGRKLKGGVLNNSGKNILNIADLNQGLYFLSVSNMKGRSCRKFVKM